MSSNKANKTTAFEFPGWQSAPTPTAVWVIANAPHSIGKWCEYDSSANVYLIKGTELFWDADDDRITIHHRPTLCQSDTNPKDWDGEGVPPAGAECEISYNGHHWIKCLINYSSESIVVCTNDSGAELAYSTKDIVRFRPIKTQQEKELHAFVEKCHESTNELGTNLDAAFIDLFDAGFRAPKSSEVENDN